jgi:hypothetical protein
VPSTRCKAAYQMSGGKTPHLRSCNCSQLGFEIRDYYVEPKARLGVPTTFRVSLDSSQYPLIGTHGCEAIFWHGLPPSSGPSGRSNPENIVARDRLLVITTRRGDHLHYGHCTKK